MLNGGAGSTDKADITIISSSLHIRTPTSQLLPLQGRRDPDRPTDFFSPSLLSSRLLQLCPIFTFLVSCRLVPSPSSHLVSFLLSTLVASLSVLLVYLLISSLPMPTLWVAVQVRLISFFSFLFRIANAILDYKCRPLGLVDSSCRSWTSWFDVGQPVYGIASICISDIPTLQDVNPTVAGERDAIMSDVCCVTV